MTLGEFKSMIRGVMKRGTALDGLLQSHIQMAVTKIERNYDYTYMEKARLLEVAVDQRIVDFPPGVLVKSISMLRWIRDDGLYVNLRKVDPKQLNAIAEGMPYRYYVAGNRQIIFDSVPDEQLIGEAILMEYSQIPNDDNYECPLLNVAPDMVMLETTRLFAVTTRDPRFLELQQVLIDEARNTMSRAEDEGKFANADLGMVYNPHPVGFVAGYTEDDGR